jgi:hypothetical protein
MAGMRDGGHGGDGSDADPIAMGGTSGGALYGAPGGPGSGPMSLDGEAGLSNAAASSNGGGGGGAAGFIVIRVPEGVMPPGADGFSPAVAPGYRVATLGTR